MAQVEHYPIDHQSTTQQQQQQQQQHLALTEELNHSLSSSIPTPPGPELDPNFVLTQELPKPPLHHSTPLSDSIDQTSQNHKSDLKPINPDLLQNQVRSNPNEENLTIDFATVDTKEEINSGSLESGPILSPNLSSDLSESYHQIESKIDNKRQDQIDSRGSERLDFQEEGKPIQTKDKDPEPVSLKTDQAVLGQDHIESTSISEVKPKATEKETPQLDSLEMLSVKKEQQIENQSEAFNPIQHNSKPMGVEDWIDISRTEVQFAVSLFAIPWLAAIVTSRSLNHFWYLIFDWHIVKPVTGLFTTIIGPPVLYTSLIALFVCLADQAESHH